MTTVAAPPDLAALYAAHRHSLVRMAVLLVDDLASAEDVVQDAFVAFHRNAGRLSDPGSALGYLRVCVVNGARSMIRRRQVARKYQHLSLQPDEAGADTEAMLADEHRTVLRALRRLPDRQREVLTLRYWSDLSDAQIAEALGISKGAVKSNASRGMRRLGEILGVSA
jgi:RNA polymerase sigma-70 factor (sigma-E family)